MASIITVNGRTIVIPDGARNVSISNNRVYVNGVDVGAGNPVLDDVEAEYVIKSDLLSLTCDRSVCVYGKIAGDVKANGSVSCDDVGGTVTAGGSVNCDDIGGNVVAGGSVNCNDVSGNVNAKGSVNHG